LNARIALAAAIAVLIVTACLIFLRGHRSAPHSDAGRSSIASAVPPSNGRSSNAMSAPAMDEGASSPPSETPASDPTKHVSLDMITRDGDAAARLWLAHAQKVIAAKNAKEYGAENAALLRLPYNEAWRALDARAAAGDDKAFLLAMVVATICENESREKMQPATPAFYEGLPDGWAAFLGRVRSMRQDGHDRRASQCTGVNLKSPMDSVLEVLDRVVRPENPEARLAIANENTDDSEAIADLRRLENDFGSKQAEAVLGDRLLESSDPAQQAEGLAILQQLAPDDVTVALQIGYCLENGCGHFSGNPPDARAWIERGAGLGDITGFGMLMADIDASGDVAAGWAWSRYKLDLSIAGCFEAQIPSYVWIREAARDETRRRRALSAAQQNAGLAVYYEISGQWQREAMETLSCAD
jgi:hypothetical protein